jgi:GntR family transcriptional regulator
VIQKKQKGGGDTLIQLNYRDSRPIYEQVKDGFRHLIIQEVMTKEEKLPSVRELATSLAINPNTIQRAYRELEQEGYIYTVPGKGSFVAGVPEQDGARKRELLEVLDKTVEELLFLGMGWGELVERIRKKSG